jgi:uncharacterized ion transporter superfamily protein YfcC
MRSGLRLTPHIFEGEFEREQIVDMWKLGKKKYLFLNIYFFWVIIFNILISQWWIKRKNLNFLKKQPN